MMLSSIDTTYLLRNSEDMIEIDNMVIDPNLIQEEEEKNFYVKSIKKFIKNNEFEINKKFFLKTIKFYLNDFLNLQKFIFFFKKNVINRDSLYIFFTYLKHYNLALKKFHLTKFKKLNLYYLFILNLKKTKPFINIIIKNKTIFAASAGFVLKKLYITEKKAKKSLKTLYLILKLIINDVHKNLKNYTKLIFQIKGSKKNLHLILQFLKKKIFFKKIIFIYTPNFYQNSIKFKKIKAIKKKLKKKFIKQ